MTRLTRQDRLQRLVGALRAYRPSRVYVFGSTARSDAHECSDLDVVVIKDTDTPFLDRLLEVGRLIPLEVGAVDLFVYTPDEFQRMRDDQNAFALLVAEEGRLVYAASEE
jgi:predicted nucleotidyltransferase